MTSCYLELFNDPCTYTYQNVILAEYALEYARKNEPLKVQERWNEYKECLKAYNEAVFQATVS